MNNDRYNLNSKEAAQSQFKTIWHHRQAQASQGVKGIDEPRMAPDGVREDRHARVPGVR